MRKWANIAPTLNDIKWIMVDIRHLYPSKLVDPIDPTTLSSTLNHYVINRLLNCRVELLLL